MLRMELEHSALPGGEEEIRDCALKRRLERAGFSHDTDRLRSLQTLMDGTSVFLNTDLRLLEKRSEIRKQIPHFEQARVSSLYETNVYLSDLKQRHMEEQHVEASHESDATKGRAAFITSGAL